MPRPNTTRKPPQQTPQLILTNITRDWRYIHQPLTISCLIGHLKDLTLTKILLTNKPTIEVYPPYAWTHNHNGTYIVVVHLQGYFFWPGDYLILPPISYTYHHHCPPPPQHTYISNLATKLLLQVKRYIKYSFENHPPSINPINNRIFGPT